MGLFALLHFVYKISFTRQNLFRLVPICLVGIILSFCILNSKYLGNYSLGRVIESAHTKFILIRNTDTKAGSSYTSCLNGTGYKEVLRSIPKALYTALFRPYLWESNNLLSLLSACESAVVLVGTLSILVLLVFRKKLISLLNTPSILFMFILSLTFFYFAAISSSNFGTLVRYKSIFMPFYLIALAVLLSRILRKQQSLMPPEQRSVPLMDDIT
jgi:hypothetical protein